MALRVCQLCSVDFTLNKFLLPLINGMEAHGWDVTSVCSDGPSISYLKSSGYKIHNIPITRSLNPLHALRSFLRLYFYFRRTHFDVLHVHTPVAALVGRLAGKLSGIPVVVYTAHGFYFHENMPPYKYQFFLLLERFAALFTDLLFCQSQEDTITAINSGLVSKKNALTIGNGVDTHLFSPITFPIRDSIRSELGIPKDSVAFCMVSRQVLEKGIVEFLQAASSLFPFYPQLSVVLVGERLASDHSSDIQSHILAAQKLFGENFVLLGPRDDIPQILHAIDVFCLPSWREGMPRSIIEAMMMQKPVIATNIRGCREEVVNNVTGILVPLRSPDCLAVAMEELLVNSSKRLRMGIAGRNRALDLYDESNVVELQITRIASSF